MGYARQVRRWRTAQNIASVPCSCGHSWRVGTSVSTSSRAAVTAATMLAGLGEHRRAGGVDDDTPGADQVERAVEQGALQRHQAVEVGELLAPPGLRASPQRAQPRARRVDEHPVEGTLRPGSGPAVVDGDLHVRTDGAAYELGTVGLRLVGDQPRAPLRGQGGEQRCLAAGTGAQVEPDLVAPLERRVGERERNQLGALVLHPGAALGDGRDVRGVATAEADAVRRERGRLPRQLVPRGPARSGDEHHGGRLVVGGQHGLELIAPLPQRPLELLDDPARVAVGHGEVADRVAGSVRRDPRHPGLEVRRRDLAQHGIDQAGVALAGPGTGEVDAGRDRRMGAHAHRQQLVGAQPEHVAQPRLHPAAVEARVEDGVVGPLPTQRAGHQLGGERGVATGQAVAAQHLRQHEVGVGVVGADRPEHVVRRHAGGISHRRGAPARAASGPSVPRRR